MNLKFVMIPILSHHDASYSSPATITTSGSIKSNHCHRYVDTGTVDTDHTGRSEISRQGDRDPCAMSVLILGFDRTFVCCNYCCDDSQTEPGASCLA